MRVNQFLRTKIGIASIVAFVVLILGIGTLAVVNLQSKGFRSIQVFKAEGAATLTRQEQVFLIHNGMHLTSGDTVIQPDEGNTQLLLDDNKYIVLEPGTTTQLLATGKEPDSHTTIHLIEGSITNQLRAPLSGNSTYEVTTPVGTMMVRGTTFRVTVIKNVDGSYSAMVEVFSGKVSVRLIMPDKTITEEIFIEAGKSAEIYGDKYVTEYVFTNKDIEYDTLPIYLIKQLFSWIKEGVLIMDEGTLETLERLLLSNKSPESSNETTLQTPEPSPMPPDLPLKAYALPPKAGESPPKAGESPSKTPVPLPQTSTQTAAEQNSTPALNPKPPSSAEHNPAPAPNPKSPSSAEHDSTPASNPKPPSSVEHDSSPAPDSESSSSSDHDSAPAPGSDSKPNPNPTPPAPSPADYTVTFRIGSDQNPGKIFAVQTVRAGETAAAPLLSPSPNFTWYVTGSSTPFSFDTPIHSNLILYNIP